MFALLKDDECNYHGDTLVMDYCPQGHTIVRPNLSFFGGWELSEHTEGI